MVRISDIIGKKEEPKEPDKERARKLTQQPPFSQFAQDLSQKIGLLDKQQTQDLYQQTLSVTVDLIQKIKQQRQKQLDISKIKEVLLRLISQVSIGNDYLFSVSYFSSPDDYLPSHLLNTCIYSLGLGINLGLDKSNLEDLALAALVFDIGIIKVYDLVNPVRDLRLKLTVSNGVNKPQKLTASEFEEVKRHTQEAEDLIKDISGLPKVVAIVINQHHERFDGSGYLQGLKGSQIHEFASIVGICDVYEALTHSRPYQKKIPPNEAIKEILQQKPLFDPKILKSFIEAIGIYPIESWVELSDGEVGKVVSVNKALILRPKINIMFDSQGQHYPDTKPIDLSKETNLYIKKALTEQNLA